MYYSKLHTHVCTHTREPTHMPTSCRLKKRRQIDWGCGRLSSSYFRRRWICYTTRI